MDPLLAGFNISSELSQTEFLNRLSCPVFSDTKISELRDAIFRHAVDNQLVQNGSVLVSRRKVGAGKTVRMKHMDDIWMMVRAIKNNIELPRVGIRSFISSQQSEKTIRLHLHIGVHVLKSPIATLSRTLTSNPPSCRTDTSSSNTPSQSTHPSLLSSSLNLHKEPKISLQVSTTKPSNLLC